MLTLSSLASVVIMLIITLLLFFGLVFLHKHFKKIIPQSECLHILSGVNVSAKSKVVMIQAMNIKILVGVTDTQVKPLYVFTEDKIKTQEAIK